MSEAEIMSMLTDVDLSKVETSFPILASGLTQVNIAKCELRRDVDKKGDEAKPYFYIEYALANPWKTVAQNGEPSKVINPGDRGSSFNERIYVGKYTDKKDGTEKVYGLDRLAKLREAAFGKAPEGQRFIPMEMIGQTITIDLIYEPAPKNKDTGEVYGPRTSVKNYIKKSKS